MADRVRHSRQQGFIGRTEQRRMFMGALRGELGAPQILFVHGIGGIGKSALLRQFAADVRDVGRTAIWVDGVHAGASTTAFEDQAAAVRSAEGPVLLVDGFEHCQPLETWLRERFLLAVPEDTLIVVAGRQRPQPHWKLDAGWRDLVRAAPLEPLDRADATTLLDERGVPEAHQPAVHRFAGGHPLALCLAADDATAFDGAGWEPGPDVVTALLGQLIDRAPSPAHQYGLRVCGHVLHTTVDLLRTGFDDETAAAVFDWLTTLPYVRPTRYGLNPHELVRDVLDADFAWRSPEEYARLHLHLWRHLGARARRATGAAAEVAVAELTYLTRYGGLPGRAFVDAVERPLLLGTRSARRVSEVEYHDAVRRALRDWHDDDAVAANPLAGIHGGGAAVRALLSDAVDALNTDPGRVKHHRVVRVTYLERTTSQEATAARLGIPFSTYRRYLSSGVRQVCEHLWARHTNTFLPPTE